MGGRKGAKHHNLKGTGTYRSWRNMRSRCMYHKDYKGRGIGYCSRWDDPVLFCKDMGDRPEGLTLERKNNDFGYWCGRSDCSDCGPLKRESNCVWADKATQQKNTRRVRLIAWGGKTQHLAAWAKEFGINSGSLSLRIDRYGSVEKAFEVSSAHPGDLRSDRSKGSELAFVKRITSRISLYRCSCGKEKQIRRSHVDKGNTRSCGHLVSGSAMDRVKSMALEVENALNDIPETDAAVSLRDTPLAKGVQT